MIVKIAIDVPIFQLFDYSWSQEELFKAPQIGDLVKVEFRKKITTGIVLQIDENNSCANDQIKNIKPVLAIASGISVTQQVINLCQFSSKYYLRPIGETLFTAIPS